MSDGIEGVIPTIIGGAVALKILDAIPEKKKRKKKKVSHKTRKKLKKVM